MKDKPFLDSTYGQAPSRETSAASERTFLLRHFGRYNLGEMAIIFGVGSVLSAVVALTCGLGIPSLPFVPTNARSVIGYASFAVWLAFVVWLWFSLVLVGKVNRESRTSDADLIRLQALFFVNVAGNALFGLLSSQADWGTWHTLSVVFEWIVIASHVLYFLLALCIWVRVPARRFAVFLAMVALAVLQTMLLAV